MASIATIPLSKGYNPKKITFPAFISEKYDGMPVKLELSNTKAFGPQVHNVSRQGTTNISVQNDAELFLNEALPLLNGVCITTFIAELTHKTITGFKNISGTVRRQQPNEFIWNFFDYTDSDSDDTFKERNQKLKDTLLFINDPRFRFVKQNKVNDLEELERFLLVNSIRKDQEGWVIRSGNDMFVPNSRSWGYQKIVVTPSEDLPLIQVDEAISKEGVPLGMAGKLWAMYEGNKIGVGPGKLTHPEREELLKQYQKGKMKGNWPSPTMEVTYKRDETYTALREARFTCWREDKD